MGTHYVDPAAAGANNGTSWTDAWTNVQSAFDTAVAADIVYCRGTQTLGAKIDVDTNSGSIVAGFIKFIGCNAAGNVDGTRFSLDATDTYASCLDSVTTAQTYIWIQNFELKQATGDGYSFLSGADNWAWVNCISHDNGGHGWSLVSSDRHLFIKCQAYNNIDTGFNGMAHDCFLVFCAAWTNGGSGYISTEPDTFYGCIAHDNGPDVGDEGFQLDTGCVMVNCIADGEKVGIYLSADMAFMLCNRITNNVTGIDFSSEVGLCGWNLFHNNTTADLANPAAFGVTYAIAIPDNADTDTNEIDPDADDGYNARATDDFNLKTSRTYNGETEYVDLNIGS